MTRLLEDVFSNTKKQTVEIILFRSSSHLPPIILMKPSDRGPLFRIVILDYLGKAFLWELSG